MILKHFFSQLLDAVRNFK